MLNKFPKMHESQIILEKQSIAGAERTTADQALFPIQQIADSFARDFLPTLYRYSAGLARFVDGEAPATLGSGTFVRMKGEYGILTALHCVRSNPRKEFNVLLDDREHTLLVSIGPTGYTVDSKTAHQCPVIQFPPGAYSVSPLYKNKDSSFGEFGPDLAFLKLAPGTELAALKARVSFANLEKPADEILEKYSHHGKLLFSVGYPSRVIPMGRQEVTTDVDAAKRITTYTLSRTCMAYIGPLNSDQIYVKEPWDYVDTTFWKLDRSGLPPWNPGKDEGSRFGGFSGGGIWAVNFKYDTKSKKFSSLDYAMVGVVFWEYPQDEEEVTLRGHYINSIYAA